MIPLLSSSRNSITLTEPIHFYLCASSQELSFRPSSAVPVSSFALQHSGCGLSLVVPADCLSQQPPSDKVGWTAASGKSAIDPTQTDAVAETDTGLPPCGASSGPEAANRNK